MDHVPSRRCQRLGALRVVAGFQVSINGRAVSSSQRNIMVKFQIDTWGESGCRVDTGTTHDG